MRLVQSAANDADGAPARTGGPSKIAAAATLRLSVAERFQTALFLSAVLHATVLLGLQFRAPPKPSKELSALNVVLVNSKSDTRPDNPQALAQANLDGGGNTDANRIAKSPVPVGDAKDVSAAATPQQPPKPKPKKGSQSAPPPRPAPPKVIAQAAEPAPPPQPQSAAIESQPPQPEEVASSVVPPTVPAEPVAESPPEEVPPQLQEVAQQEEEARARVAELEREARELMTQLKSERVIAQPSAEFTVPPDYQPRPSPPRSEQADNGTTSPAPSATASSSSARVITVPPREAAMHAARPEIKVPPKEERKPSSTPAPATLARVEANAGLRTTATQQATEPVEAQPIPKPQPPLPQPPLPRVAEPKVEVREAPKVEAAKPEPTPKPEIKAEPPKPEVKIVRLEPKFAPVEQPELKPQREQPQEPLRPEPQAQPQAQPTPEVVARVEPEQPSEPAKPNLPSAAELMRRSSEIARLEAQIAKNYDDYQKRPRRKFIGARTQEFRFATYIEEWRAKVERIGNLNYPEAAKQRRIYGSLQLTVAIRADGGVESVEINRSSGQKVLDAAAVRIVELAGPYSQFPPEISKDTDILHITRTWTFTRSDQLVSE